MTRLRLICAVGAIALALTASGAGAAASDGYHDRAAVEAALQRWAEASPLISLQRIGSSAGGHPLWLAEIAGDGPVAAGERPAIFVGANVAGDHHAGTEAALHLIETLAAAEGETATLLAAHTFYVAPVLNPDAHDAFFAAVRLRRQGNATAIDRDRDGLIAEDDADDLDGDGRITTLRIADPAGGWLPHPDEPRLMVRADAAKGWLGAYRLIAREGDDNDGDGAFNEDPREGVSVDMNFPHAFPFPEPAAGPFAMYTPESQALADFLLARRNVALAVVYGPANNLLAAPRSLGGGGDLGTQTFKLPPQAAEILGFDPEQEYTIDEVWDTAKDLPFVRQNNITKEQLTRFLGAGPATEVEDDDSAVLATLGKDYKKRLEDAGLDHGRPAEQYGKGGLTPWLYYQYGALAFELDVWGVPKAKAAEGEEDGETAAPLTVESLAAMSKDEFLALGEEPITAFLKEIGAPPQFNAQMIIQRVEGDQVTPQQMAEMIKRMPGAAGAGGGDGDDDEDDADTKRAREVLAWIDQHAPESFAPWTEVTLADGTRAEVGGLDPFAAVAPPRALLDDALAAHTATVLDAAARLAAIEIVSVTAEHLGGGVYRVEAVARNTGELATHTKMAARANARLPIRLALEPGDDATLVTGYPAVTAPRLDGRTGTLEGSWLVRAADGTSIAVTLRSEAAGNDRTTHTLTAGGSR